MRRGLGVILAAGVASSGLCGVEARAGGGPERTLLVVNERSPVSVRVAQHWARLREIHDEHVLYLPDVPGGAYAGQATTGLSEVRDRILLPIFEYLDRADLVNEIDLIVYSTGFPYVIDVREFAERVGVIGATTASLTGVTYFAHAVLREDPVFLQLTGNAYFRGGLPGAGASLRELNSTELRLQREGHQAYKEKQYKKSAELFEQLVETYREDALTWYNLACDYALQGLRTRALDALEQSVAHGYSDPFWTLVDPDLVSVRPLEEFRVLVQRMRDRKPQMLDPHGFRAAATWDLKAEPTRMSIWDAKERKNGGYYLSMVLGWTGLHGNTEQEICDALTRSAEVDGTRPGGAVYLMRSRDKRSRARSGFLSSVEEELTAMGRDVVQIDHSVEGQDGVFPRGKIDVFGVVSGGAEVDVREAGTLLMPGSIIDNLTGFGAAFWNPGETKCTHFVRYGAGAVSGSVTDGGLVAAKYPTPRLHGYYAAGCSAAEAFYQATSAPYPMLFLGDALARPFAKFARVSLARPEQLAKPLSGDVKLHARVQPADGAEVERLELYVDGWLAATAAPGEPFDFDTRPLDDGVHRGAIVAVEKSAIETRSRVAIDLRISNVGRSVAWTAVESRVPIDGRFVLRGSAPGADRVQILRGGTAVAVVPVNEDVFEASIPAARLGRGASRLWARADYSSAPRARSAVLDLEVEAERALAGEVEDGWSLAGLVGVAKSPKGAKQQFGLTSLHPGCAWQLWDACQDVGGEPGTKIELIGEFRADAGGLHELAFFSSMEMKVSVDEVVVLQQAAGHPTTVCAELNLEAGWHPIKIELTTPDALYQLQCLVSGASRPDWLGGDRLRHRLSGTRLVSTAPGLQMSGVRAEEFLIDGDRVTEAQPISSGHLSMEWRKYQKNLNGVVIYPVAPPDAKGFAVPTDWLVERRSGSSGWRKASGLELTLGWDPERGSREQGAVPAWILLKFNAMSAREIRLRPADGKDAPANVPMTEVEVLEKRGARG